MRGEFGWHWRRGGPDIALDVWVTQEQEGFAGERVLCHLLLLCNPDIQSSVWDTEGLRVERTANEQSESLAVQRTTVLGGFTTTSTAGSFSQNVRGIMDYAIPRVSVGSDGLEFAFTGAGISYLGFVAQGRSWTLGLRRCGRRGISRGTATGRCSRSGRM